MDSSDECANLHNEQQHFNKGTLWEALKSFSRLPTTNIVTPSNVQSVVETGPGNIQQPDETGPTVDCMHDCENTYYSGTTGSGDLPNSEKKNGFMTDVYNRKMMGFKFCFGQTHLMSVKECQYKGYVYRTRNGADDTEQLQDNPKIEWEQIVRENEKLKTELERKQIEIRDVEGEKNMELESIEKQQEKSKIELERQGQEIEQLRVELVRQKQRVRDVKEEKENALESMEKQQEKSKIELERKGQEIEQLRVELMRQKQRIRDVEEDKENALERLSELMSTRLRDNNPNIVDLSDKYRPTKLAEMMSELYDNQWTDLCTYMEKSWNEDEGFPEEKCIQFLLNIVMETYTFCCNIASTGWTDGIDKLFWTKEADALGSDMLKVVKDFRKENAFGVMPQITENCLEALQKIPLSDVFHLDLFIDTKEMKEYFNECVKLCWLMVLQDPPMSIHSTGWKSKQNIPTSENNKEDIQTLDEMSSREEDGIQEESKLSTRNNHVQGLDSDLACDLTCEESRGNLEEDRSNVTTSLNESNMEVDPSPSTDILQGKVDQATKIIFVKEHYREYTRRGNHVQYFVWPMIYLYEGGPVLSKGVAQGCN